MPVHTVAVFVFVDDLRQLIYRRKKDARVYAVSSLYRLKSIHFS